METNIVLVAFILFIRPNIKINVFYGENSPILYVGMKSANSIGHVAVNKFFKDDKRESSQLFSILDMFKKRHFYQCIS